MKRSGMATILAIVSVGLVTTTLATMSILLAGQRRLTISNSADAQVCQLLLAGAADVSERAKQWGNSAPTEKWSISLPDELNRGGAELIAHIATTSGPTTMVELTAKAANHHGHQRLEYRQIVGHWQFVSAQLGE